MSLAASRPGAGCWERSSSVSREGMSLTIALTVRVVCLSSTRSPAFSGRSATWQTVASMSRVGTGAPALGAMRSPRETSRSSARRRVTDCGAQAAATPRPSASMPVMVLVRPEGRTVTASPTRSTPDDICPA